MVPDLSFTGLISHHSFSVTFSTPRPPPLLLFRSQKKLRVYVSNTWSVPPTTMVDLVLLQPRCSTSWPCRTFSTLLMSTFSFSRIRWSLQTWQTQSDSIRDRPHTNVSFADSVLCGDMEIKDYFSSCLADKTTSYLLVHWFWSSRWHMTFSGDHVCTPLGSSHTRFRWGVVKRSTLRPIPINGESFGRKTKSANFHVINWKLNSWHYLTDIHLVLTENKVQKTKKTFERSEMGILRKEKMEVASYKVKKTRS